MHICYDLEFDLDSFIQEMELRRSADAQGRDAEDTAEDGANDEAPYPHH